jgi:plastocyanin
MRRPIPRRTVGALLLFLVTASARAETIQIKIEKLTFVPSQVSAHVGDTIEWVNADFVAHTATARDGAWDVMIAPSATASVVVKADGTVDYYCRFHPNMIGQILQLVEQATDNLPEIFRLVFVTRVIEGMSVEETSELLGIKPETVKTRLHRARQLVRDQLDKQIGPVLMDAFPFAGRRCERMTEGVMTRLGFAE